MRVLRATIAVVVFTLGGLLIAAPVSAQTSQITVGNVTLGPEGTTLLVPVTVVCDVGDYLAIVSANVSQSLPVTSTVSSITHTGQKFVQAGGTNYYYLNSFPGLACTGAPQTVSITAYIGVYYSSTITFKQGRAAAVAIVYTYDPANSIYSENYLGPVQVRISST